MVRVISQATYDDVVKENIDVDMSPEEAIKDAIAQFEAQGVDLSNVIKDLALSGGREEHVVCTAVAALRGLQESWRQHKQELVTQLDVLKSECIKDLARRVRAAKEGAYPVLIHFLEESMEHSRDEDLTVKIVETLTELMDTQPDLLDDKGLDLMKKLTKCKPIDTTVGCLRWISTACLKHERNRQAVFKSDLVSQLLQLLKEPLESKALSELLLVFRRLVLDDDVRVEFGKAHEHARQIATHSIARLTELLKENASDASLASDLMLAVASLLVRHELCQAVADAGGAAILFDVTTLHYDNAAVTRQALKLIKALAGNDDVKRALVKSGITPVIVSLLNRHMSDANAAALGLSCMTALTLREPGHSEEFVDNGAAEAVVEAMKRHADVVSVQRNACWAIRNTVARCRHVSQRFLELGVEASLNAAQQRFGAQITQDVTSALRELGCAVALQEQWRGAGVQMQND